MEADFWHERWQQGQIGFHQAAVNDALLGHWAATVGPAASRRVLVPLCGKSVDLRWLHGQGHRVLGVELSALACDAFFAEQGLPVEVRPLGGGRWYQGQGAAAGLDLLQGDIFGLDLDALAAADLAPCPLLYDRASLVAMPEAMRARLAARLLQLLSTDASGLIVTFDYPQDERPGPPFSVPPAVLAGLFAAEASLDVLQSNDLLAHDRSGRWTTSSLVEHVCRWRRGA